MMKSEDMKQVTKFDWRGPGQKLDKNHPGYKSAMKNQQVYKSAQDFLSEGVVATAAGQEQPTDLDKQIAEGKERTQFSGPPMIGTITAPAVGISTHTHTN
jgi:hypothetical protein